MFVKGGSRQRCRASAVSVVALDRQSTAAMIGSSGDDVTFQKMTIGATTHPR
jgi:hypothetical protein